MALPKLEFASINLSTATIYSTASNSDNFIRVRANYSSGQNTVTVTSDQAGYFGQDMIEEGYFLRSVGEVSTPVEITDWNPGTGVITIDGVAEQDNDTQTTRISLPRGKIFIESASFQKVGGSNLNPPTDFRGVTGSLDADYDPTELKWGVIGQLASTSSINNSLVGLYAQYELTYFDSRIDNTTANIFLTASDTVPAFKEPEGYTLARQDSISSLLLSEISGSFMTIAGSGDISGNQSLGLASYQNVIASTIALFISSSFPYTGSAEITGSLEVTGSVDFLINSYVDVNNVGELFKVSNALTPTQSLFSINQEGVATFRAREGSDGTPPVTVGSMYFTTESVFFGIDDGE